MVHLSVALAVGSVQAGPHIGSDIESIWAKLCVGSTRVEPHVERVSFTPRSDGQGFVVRFHVVGSVAAFSQPRELSSGELELVLFNTGLAPTYQADHAAGPVAEYSVEKVTGHLVFRFRLDPERPVHMAAYRDRDSEDLILGLTYAIIHEDHASAGVATFVTAELTSVAPFHRLVRAGVGAAASAHSELGELPHGSAREDGTSGVGSASELGGLPHGSAREDGTSGVGSASELGELPHGSAHEDGTSGVGSASELGELPHGSAREDGTSGVGSASELGELPHGSAHEDRAPAQYASAAEPFLVRVASLPVVPLESGVILPGGTSGAGGSEEAAASEEAVSAAEGRHWMLDTVVIDAGHGGKDSGAMGHGVREKDIALKVALKLGHYLEDRLGVQVVYTREDDRFIELKDRGRIANEHGAKLFISIHVNAATNARAQGTETYFIGLHKTTAAQETMRRENEVVKLESSQSEYEDMTEEALIRMALTQSAYMQKSEELSGLIQEQFEKRVHRKNRGVKQAGFYVLWGASMPAVLVELGFLSNREEAAFMNSELGQDYLASAIFRAVREYKERYERGLVP